MSDHNVSVFLEMVAAAPEPKSLDMAVLGIERSGQLQLGSLRYGLWLAITFTPWVNPLDLVPVFPSLLAWSK